MCKKEKSAYMTVEASLLIPVILGGIIFILYVGFYLYNFAVMKQTAYIAALRGSQIKQVSSDRIESYVEEQVDELLRQRILAKEDIKKEIKVSKGSIKVKLYTNIKIFLEEFLPFGKKSWEIKGEAKVDRVDPIEIIRGARKINGH